MADGGRLVAQFRQDFRKAGLGPQIGTGVELAPEMARIVRECAGPDRQFRRLQCS